MKVVIIGGVAGGATAAARLRRLDESAEIIVIERTGYVSYANCGLPYYIGGVIEDSRELTLQTPEGFRRRFNMDVRVNQEVIRIDPASKTITVRISDSGDSYTETYDRLIISTGAKAVVPRLPGIDDSRIFTLRTVEDTFAIHRFVTAVRPSSAVIVGGGFIGLETAENLHEAGVDVTIVQRPGQLMNTMDYDMAVMIHAALRAKGIKVLTGADVTGFNCEGERIKVQLQNRQPIETDMVLMAIGVTPDTALAADAGLRLGIKNSIVVDEHMRTSVPDIYAVGDAVTVRHTITGKDALISLAGPANKQGRIAADNICNIPSSYKGSMGSSVIKLFDMTAAVTGLTEKTAENAGISFEKIVLTPASHASYYPDARTMTMKILYEKGTLRLLGAQIVGYDGVDKRIDVLATAICAGMKADRLKDLELAYAPPFSSAKDPVNMAGFMIDNIENGMMKQFHWDQVDMLPRDGSVTLLDTRTESEYARGHVEGFSSMPVDELRDRIPEIPQGKPVYVMCQSGLRSYIACRILMHHGFDCYNFSGGYRFYESIAENRPAADSSYPCGMDR